MAPDNGLLKQGGWPGPPSLYLRQRAISKGAGDGFR